MRQIGAAAADTQADAPERLFFNFDDDRLTSFNIDNFTDLCEVFAELYGNENYYYFDEIQNIPGWEHFVKRLYNQGKRYS